MGCDSVAMELTSASSIGYLADQLSVSLCSHEVIDILVMGVTETVQVLIDNGYWIYGLHWLTLLEESAYFTLVLN